MFLFSFKLDSDGVRIIDGGWSVWTVSTCSVTCGSGTEQATRTCTNPTPSSNDGNKCIGLASKSEGCNTGRGCVGMNTPLIRHNYVVMRKKLVSKMLVYPTVFTRFNNALELTTPLN